MASLTSEAFLSDRGATKPIFDLGSSFSRPAICSGLQPFAWLRLIIQPAL